MTSIDDFEEKSNPVVRFADSPQESSSFWSNIYSRIKPFYGVLLILVVATIFFALGRLSALEDRHVPVKIEYPSNPVSATDTTAPSQTARVAEAISPNVSSSVTTVPVGDGSVIGSKSGKKYYYPWCGTAKRIKPENQVPFASISAAREAGFVPGGNCKGLK